MDCLVRRLCGLLAFSVDYQRRLHPYTTVFIKGVEKFRFLSAYHEYVKDLSDINTSKYYDTLTYRDVNCTVIRQEFVFRKDEKYVYALRETQFIAKWLRTNGPDLGKICETCGQFSLLN